MTDPTASVLTTPDGRPVRVLAVAVTARRRAQVVRLLRAVARHGGQATLLTADGGRGADPGPGVTRIDLASAERTWGPHKLLLLDPRRVLARVGIGRRPTGAPPLWRRWSSSRVYAAVRYWVLWRALAPRAHELRAAEITHILIVGVESWPITWHLVRGRSDVTIGFDLPSGLLPPEPEDDDEDAVLGEAPGPAGAR